MTMTEERMVSLPVGDIFPNPDQPRRDFGQAGLDELARSITATHGVMEPIVVKPVDGRYMIIAGERRWRATQIAGLDTIPAIVRDVDDKTLALMALVENVVRQDLTVAEEGQFMKKLLDNGVTWEEISEMLGTDRIYLEWKVEIVEKCHETIVWLAAKGHLTGNMAYRLSKLSHDGQMRFLRETQNCKKPLTQQEQIGLIEAILKEENQLDMLPETKLTDEQREAAVVFAQVVDRALIAAERLEKMEEKLPGTLGLALATELDLAVLKLGQLQARIGRIQRTLQRRQGSMALRKAGLSDASQ